GAPHARRRLRLVPHFQVPASSLAGSSAPTINEPCQRRVEMRRILCDCSPIEMRVPRLGDQGRMQAAERHDVLGQPVVQVLFGIGVHKFAQDGYVVTDRSSRLIRETRLAAERRLQVVGQYLESPFPVEVPVGLSLPAELLDTAKQLTLNPPGLSRL